MKSIGIKFKILCFFMVLIMVLTLLTTSYHSQRMKSLTLQSAKDIQTKFTKQIGFSLAEPLDYDLSDEVERLIVRARKDNPEIKYIYVYNKAGHVINQYGIAPKVDFSSLSQDKEGIVDYRPNISNDYLIEYFYKIKINQLTRFYLRVGYDNTKYESFIDEIIYDYIKITYAVVVVIMIIGYFFFKSILFAPLARLLDEMVSTQRQFSEGKDFTLEGKDEIVYLHNYFNMLIKSVKEKNFQLKDLNTNLEKKVEERTDELKKTQAKLLESAHMAGMATMAAGVLHNIGNILTLAHNTALNVKRIVDSSSIQYFSKIENHIETVDQSKIGEEGKNIIKAYGELSKEIKSEHEDLVAQLNTLGNANRTMLKTVQSQQKYAKVGNFLIEVKIDDIIKDSIQLLSESLGKHKVNIHYHQEEVRPIQANKSNLLNVFVNLLLNAKESILLCKDHNNPMTVDITIYEDEGGEIYIRYTDTGIGMGEETLENLFKFGYTTKEKGSGFGLHDAANTIKELGGEIKAYSDGEGKGATIEIVIPSQVS